MQPKNRMRENRTSGSAWGVPGNRHSYHEMLLDGMKLLEEKALDFGDLQLVQKKCHCKHGKVFYQFDFNGRFDGFQEGPAGNSFFYLEEFLPKADRVLFNFTETEFFSDIGPSVIKKWWKINKERDGFLLLASPNPFLAEVLEIMRFNYIKTLEEAYDIIDDIENHNNTLHADLVGPADSTSLLQRIISNIFKLFGLTPPGR